MSQIRGRLIEAAGESIEAQPKTRKSYARPEIIHELELETRAGSPLLIEPVDPLNPLVSEPKK